MRSDVYKDYYSEIKWSLKCVFTGIKRNDFLMKEDIFVLNYDTEKYGTKIKLSLSIPEDRFDDFWNNKLKSDDIGIYIKKKSGKLDVAISSDEKECPVYIVGSIEPLRYYVAITGTIEKIPELKTFENVRNDDTNKRIDKEEIKKTKERRRNYQFSLSEKSQLHNNNIVHLYSSKDYAIISKKKAEEAAVCVGCSNNKNGYCMFYKAWADKARQYCQGKYRDTSNE